MKVLIIAHGHPEFQPAGAEIAAHALFQALRDTDGIEAWFMARTDEPGHARTGTHFSNYFGRPDEILLHTTEAEHFLFSQPSENLLREFAEFIERLAPDVVHFHHYVHLGLELIAVVRRVLPNCRILLTLHEFLAICNHNGQMVKTGSFELCNESSPAACARCFPETSSTDFFMRQRFIQAHFDKVDQFIAPSEFLRQRYIRWGIPEDRIVMMENLLPPMEPVPPRPLAEGERRSIFAYFGQINPYKGTRVLIDAFDILEEQEDTEDIRLLIFGTEPKYSPPEFQEWFAEAIKRNPKRVSYQGPYRRENLAGLMKSIDWAVVPSLWWENSPIVIQEAFGCGRPVICSDIGGMAEKIENDITGLHFAAGNAISLSNILLRSANITEWDKCRQAVIEKQDKSSSTAHINSLYR